MLGPLLQYQSLKTVLLHTDANTRFRIGTHMPSIREVEKKIPLKISCLDMSKDYRTVVDNTSYQVDIIRCHHEGNVPIKQDQEWVLSYADFDEFGFPFDAGINVMLPGDVLFQPEDRRYALQDTREHEIAYITKLRAHEEALKMQEESKSKGITVEDYLKSLGPISVERQGRSILAQQFSPEQLSHRIEFYKLTLLPFDCRRNNTKTPFTCYIQLTITKGESRQIQRFEYNKKLFEASKSLHETLFGRRTVPIHVDCLVLNGWETIHRLPTGFRVHANHVNTSHYTVTHNSFRALVENSESLESIKMAYYERGDAFQTEIVRRAKRLVITNAFSFVMQRLKEGIRHLPNLEIAIVDLISHTPDEIFSLIQAWLSADRPVGASCCLEVKDEKTAEKILRLVQTRYETTNRTDRCVTIQKTDLTRVELCYVSSVPQCLNCVYC